MILNRQNLLLAVAITLLGVIGASCVDIPSSAPEPPVLQAQYRFISVNPSSFTTPSSVLIAEGPDFKSYKTLTIGANVTPTGYITMNAGTKRIVYNNGIQNDTLVVTLGVDELGTVAFARNTKPSTDTSLLVDAVKMYGRRIYSPNGDAASAIVKFSNFAQGITVGVDVVASDSTLAAGVVKLANLAFEKTDYVKVPVGKKQCFFFTKTGKLTDRIYKDSVVITGAANKVYNVFAYDKYDSTALPATSRTILVKTLEGF